MDFQEFLRYLSTEKRSSVHTVTAYGGDLAQFSAFCARSFEVTDPQEVSAPMVRSWLAEMVQEGYKPTSVHRKISSVHAWFRFLQKNGVVTSNPARGLAKPKLPRRLPTFVDEKGAMALYEVPVAGQTDFSSVRNRLMVTFFYETGLRLSELIGLLDSDVDEGQRVVKVLGKRNKMRMVPVSAETVSAIQAYRELRDRQGFPEKSLTLFVTDRGQKLNKTFVYTTVKKYLSLVTTIRKKSPHVLRHTFATHMLNNGAELNAIKEILGHSSLAATQVYTHLSVEKLKGIHRQLFPRQN